jgi:hypothetical protein
MQLFTDRTTERGVLLYNAEIDRVLSIILGWRMVLPGLAWWQAMHGLDIAYQAGEFWQLSLASVLCCSQQIWAIDLI